MKNKLIYGTWQVTTEGDCEGRSIKNLGQHTGYIDEIALHLADKCYYSLTFEVVEPVAAYTPTSTEVHVHLRYGDYSLKDVSAMFKEANRPVEITSSNYYRSFKIVTKNKEEIRKNLLIQSALTKLTDAERKALGL